MPRSIGQELPGPVDRLALEVVAEAPVAEHLEEGVVAGGPPDLLEVVVLAGHAQDALVVDGPAVAPGLGAGQDVLELDHPAVREEEGLVAAGDQARRTRRPRGRARRRRRRTAAGSRRRAGPGSGGPGARWGAASAVTVPNRPRAPEPGPGRARSSRGRRQPAGPRRRNRRQSRDPAMAAPTRTPIVRPRTNGPDPPRPDRRPAHDRFRSGPSATRIDTMPIPTSSAERTPRGHVEVARGGPGRCPAGRRASRRPTRRGSRRRGPPGRRAPIDPRTKT